MIVHIKVVDGYNLITSKIIPLENYDELTDAIKRLQHKKKTFYVMLFDENGLQKDLMKFEKGKRIL